MDGVLLPCWHTTAFHSMVHGVQCWGELSPYAVVVNKVLWKEAWQGAKYVKLCAEQALHCVCDLQKVSRCQCVTKGITSKA